MADSRSSTPTLELLLGALVGIIPGLFGIGGGIVVVPLLIFVLKTTQKAAHATSLVAVSVMAVAGATSFAAAGKVAWWPAVVIAGGGLAGSWLGSLVLHRIDDRLLRRLFGVFLLITAVWMAISSRQDPSDENINTSFEIGLDTVAYLVTGGVAGVLSALLGTGGGIIMIPVLVLFGGFDQHLAEGTSLAAMVAITLVGAARLTHFGYVNWPRGLRFGLGGALGVPLGALLAFQLSSPALQAAFAAVLVITAIQLLASQPRQPDGDAG